MKKFLQTHPPITKAIRTIHMFQPWSGSSSGALLKNCTIQKYYRITCRSRVAETRLRRNKWPQCIRRHSLYRRVPRKPCRCARRYMPTSRVARFFLVQTTKWRKYTKIPRSIPNVNKNITVIDQVSIKYTNIFHCKTLQNLPKFGFFVWKENIWQPCLHPSAYLNHLFSLLVLLPKWGR
jgi:hypothetical protein